MSNRDADNPPPGNASRGTADERATRPGFDPDELAHKATRRIPAPQLGGLLAQTQHAPSSMPPPLARPPQTSERVSVAGGRLGSRALWAVGVATLLVIVGGIVFLMMGSGR